MGRKAPALNIKKPKTSTNPDDYPELNDLLENGKLALIAPKPLPEESQGKIQEEQDETKAGIKRSLSKEVFSDMKPLDPEIEEEIQKRASMPEKSTQGNVEVICKEDRSGSVLPHISPNSIKDTLEINELLIQLMKEYQDRGWQSDPDFIIFQRKLLSNLIHLNAIADHYLNPQKVKGYIPKTRRAANERNPPKPIPSDRISKALHVLSTNYKKKVEVIDPRLVLFDEVAGEITKEYEFNESMKAQENVNTTTNPPPSPYDKCFVNRVFDQPVKMGDPMTFKPFPPFEFPNEIEIPDIDELS